MKVGFIGGGSWGSTLANLLSDNGHETLVYDINIDTVNMINTSHAHPFFDCVLNDDVIATNNLSDVDVVVDGKALMDGERFREGKKVPVVFQLTAPVETRVEGKIRLTNEFGQSKTFDVIIVELM